MLKKGDKVIIIPPHRYAEVYKNKVFTCKTDEEEYDGNKVVFLQDLSEFGASMSVKFLKKIK